MASWWNLIAAQQGAYSSSLGPYPKRVAFKLAAQSMNGLTWEAKLASRKAFGGSGSWMRRLVNFSGSTPTYRTAYGTAGSWGRNILFQNNLGTAVPAGNKSISPPARSMGVG